MINIQENIPLKDYTTFKIGGIARYFVVIKTLPELMEAILFSKEKEIPFFVLGGGSNILVSENGFLGLVIKNEIKKKVCVEMSPEDCNVTFGAGENWDEAVAYTVTRGLFGLENLSGIPGTVGASPVQNIGAYGQEVKNVICSLKAINTETLDEKMFTNSDCQFSYRNSIFKKPEFKKYIITEVSFFLKKNGEVNTGYKDLQLYFLSKKNKKPSLVGVREAVLEIRAEKFPSLEEYGLAGSFFKNPIITSEKYQELKGKFPNLPAFEEGKGMVKIPLAWVLDKICNLKGYREGKVGLYEKQPIILVNYGGATAREVSIFADKIIKVIKEKTDLDVEWEVERV